MSFRNDATNLVSIIEDVPCQTSHYVLLHDHEHAFSQRHSEEGGVLVSGAALSDISLAQLKFQLQSSHPLSIFRTGSKRPTKTHTGGRLDLLLISVAVLLHPIGDGKQQHPI